MPEGLRSRSEAPASEASKARHLRQVASEIILSAPDLTDELTDNEARPLIRWGVMQAEAAADDLAQASRATGGGASGRDPGDILADGLDPVRRVMKRTNRLAGSRHDLSPEEVLEELGRLVALAEGLPRPPQPEVAAVSVAELGARGTELDNGAMVQAIVALLEGSTWSGAQDRSQQLDQGVEDDKGDTAELGRTRDCGDASPGDPSADPGRIPVPGRRAPGCGCS